MMEIIFSRGHYPFALEIKKCFARLTLSSLVIDPQPLSAYFHYLKYIPKDWFMKTFQIGLIG